MVIERLQLSSNLMTTRPPMSAILVFSTVMSQHVTSLIKLFLAETSWPRKGGRGG